jgi:cytochrome P450
MGRPAPLETQPVKVIASELRDELRVRGHYPPGPSGFSLGRTLQTTRDPLPLLLELYERHGPVFSFRALHQRMVWMIGPEANQFITVSHPEHFHWREGHLGDLTPLIGDGILTTDGEYHDRARRLMMPAFHQRQLEAAVEVMLSETRAALDGWAPGQTVDVYEWTRRLALRIAMRALLGLDPEDEGHGAAAAHHFERGLAFYGTDAHLRILRGPRTPWARMQAARRALDEIVYAEIARRRRHPTPGRMDVMSALIDAEDEDGSRFSDEEVRDQLVTLMFAGHDTSSSNVAFLLYELARHRDVLERIRGEQERVLAGEPPTAAQLHGELPELEMAIDEALRLYPPVWIGARRSVNRFVFAGHEVPEGAYVNYSSWASHRLPHVFPEPEAFIPERFSRERKAALPKGAYIPFGGGSRICIGKRFGQTVVRTVATLLLQRFSPGLPPGHELRLALEPTLSPRGGLPLTLRSA